MAVLDTGVDARDPGSRRGRPRRRRALVRPGRARSGGATDDGHGTHLAGIIAASSGNGVGGSGVAAARILPITIADAQGRSTTSALVKGLRYATARRARVINISFGGRGYSRQEQLAIDAAVRAGALVVVAVGNTGGRGGPPQFPGAYRQVVAVAAVGRTGRALALSERGPQVSIAAPVRLWRRSRRADREAVAASALVVRSGTSVAAAIVSGAAARLMAQRPEISAPQVRAILEATARDLPPSGPDSATGVGIVDLAAALAAPTPPPPDPEPNDDTALAGRTRRCAWGPAPATRTDARARSGPGATPRRVPRPPRRRRHRHRAPRHQGAGEPRAGASGGRGPPPAGATAASRAWLLAASQGIVPSDTIASIVPRTGTYTLEVQGVRGETGYPPPVHYSVTIEAQGFRPAVAGSRMVSR